LSFRSVLIAVVIAFGLIADIFLAHSQNDSPRRSEYVPLYFSMAATLALAVAVPLRARMPGVWRDVGHLIGWLAVLLGLAGVILASRTATRVPRGSAFIDHRRKVGAGNPEHSELSRRLLA
jgi:hypothetical protein